MFHLFLLFLFFADPKFSMITQIDQKGVVNVHIWGKILNSRHSGRKCLKPVSYEVFTNSRLTVLLKKIFCYQILLL